MRTSSTTPFLTSLCLVAAACSATPGTGMPDGAVATGCAALKDTCLANQTACVESGGMAMCMACPSGNYAALDGTCQPLEGTALTHDFAMFTTSPGQEVLGLCQSWTLGNATELWVSSVELTQDEASHHSNWTFVPDDQFPGPDGVWMCGERNYNQLTAALAGGVLYAQSTQAKHEVQHFPNGAAVRIPPYSRIIGDVHLLNASPNSITGHARLAIYTLAASDVKVKLAPFHITFDALSIAPHGVTRHYTDCDIGTQFEGDVGKAWDLKIYYMLPHTHALGTRFFVRVNDGPLDGQYILDARGFNSEPHGRAYDPPIALAGASGLHFGCEHDNPRDVEVNWGFGDQEMCEALGFADTAKVFESKVTMVYPAAADGSTQQRTGGCGTILYNWDPNRPGGPPP